MKSILLENTHSGTSNFGYPKIEHDGAIMNVHMFTMEDDGVAMDTQKSIKVLCMFSPLMWLIWHL